MDLHIPDVHLRALTLCCFHSFSIQPMGLHMCITNRDGLGQYRLMEYGLVQYGLAQCGLIEYGLEQYGLVQYGLEQYGIVQYGLVECGPVQYGPGQYGLICYVSSCSDLLQGLPRSLTA